MLEKQSKNVFKFNHFLGDKYILYASALHTATSAEADWKQGDLF
jgi:hypothetical protein